MTWILLNLFVVNFVEFKLELYKIHFNLIELTP